MAKFQRILSAQIPEEKKAGEKVMIKGWIHNIRVLGGLAFVVIRDRMGMIQVVVDDERIVGELGNLQPGTVVKVVGEVKETDKTDLGVELVNPEIEFINKVTHPWPVEINKPELQANLDTILDNRALVLRHPKQAAIFKIQGVMAQAYRTYMVEHGFTEFFGPAMTASSSEGGAEVFKLDYFGKEATLAQSNQLYKQIMVGVYGRVFGMAKWFRAENSNTRRHLTEGMQYEFELGFIESIDDVLDHLEAVTSFMIRQVEEKCQPQLKTLDKELVKLPPKGKKYPRVTLEKALEIISERTGEDTKGWDDLTTETERELCAYAREEHGTDFIIVTNYPKGKFYAYKDDEGVYHNFDLLCREAEIVSGGRRVDNYDKLVEEIKKEGMNPDAFEEYLSIFKYGMPPHGGFGLGFERFTMMALGLENIREATIFPSDPKRVASQHLPDEGAVGAETIKAEIKNLFVDADLEFRVMKHEPTPTSQDAANVRGLDIDTGVKALILRDKKSDKNVLVNVPAGKKLDIKAFTKYYNEKHPESGQNAKFEFEKPEVIEEKYGLKVGGVPPFGHIFNVETYYDEGIFDQEEAAFNNADLEESLITTSAAIKEVFEGEIGKFAE
jgi:nondiscriminating aspartyl-tRNA synthetase